MAFTEEEEQGLRAMLKIFRTQVPSLSDDAALIALEIVNGWDGDGHEYVEGERFTYNGDLYRVIFPGKYVSQPDHTPDATPSVYAKVLPGQEGTGAGEWEQPGPTNAYQKGDRVWHNGRLWESMYDGPNVWEPGVVGVGEDIWKDVTEEA